MKPSNAPTPSFVPDDVVAEATSAIEWWREAGLDADLRNEVTAWLSEDEKAASKSDSSIGIGTANPGSQAGPQPPTAKSKTDSPATQRQDFFGGQKPKDLMEFREFWLNAPNLDAVGPNGRVAPRGPSQPDVMILVLDPEEGDRDRLLSGPQGALLNAMLAVMNIDEDEIYIASALPRHTPLADTKRLASEGLGAVLLHHIALVKPKRLLGFGAGLAPFLDEIVNSTRDDLRKINHVSPVSNALLTDGLDTLMDMPRLKARFWRKWIEWSAEQS